MDQEVRYTLRLVDNVSASARTMADAQKDLKKETDESNKSKEEGTLEYLRQSTAVSQLDRGFRRMTYGIVELGLVGQNTAQVLNKMSALVGITAGTFNLLKGAAGVVKMITGAEAGLAAVRTYNAMLRNPALIGVVIAGVGAAGYVAGRFASGGNTSNTTVNNNVVFEGGSTSEKRSMSSGALEVMGG